MNPEIKAAWLAALRSGEYEQGHGYLKYEGRFCCLGVLCDLHSKATGRQWDGHMYIHSSGFLSRPVMEWAGLPDSYGTVITPDGESVIDLNDAAVPFDKIADKLEGL